MRGSMGGLATAVASWMVSVLALTPMTTPASAAVTTQAASEPVSGSVLPEQVRGGVVVDLADGDRFKVWHSRDMRTVRGQRYDAATSSWGEKRTILRERKLFCGGVDARAAGTSVAITARCDRGGYHEESAPTSSRALWSSDLLSWRVHRLDGEAYQEPGISPDGASAVWPQGSGYLTLTPADGFVDRSISVPGVEYSETAVIDDQGRVSVLYGARDAGGNDCGLAVVTQLRDGPPVRQHLPVPDGCSVEHDLVNVDARTVLSGQPRERAHAAVVGRPDTATAWAVTSPAPADAPDLVTHEGRAHTRFLDAPGLPLVALGSSDGARFAAQSYDPASRTWSAPRPVAQLAGPCRWQVRHASALPLSVLVAGVRCDGRDRGLISTDGSSWATVSLRRPLGVSADRRWVSTSTRRVTSVFSREEGRVDVPLGAPRRCDVVLPASPTSVLRLTTPRATGWPTVLQRSTGSRWRRTDTAVPLARAGTETCTGVRSELHETLPTYWFHGRSRALILTVEARGDGWAVRRAVR